MYRKEEWNPIQRGMTAAYFALKNMITHRLEHTLLPSAQKNRDCIFGKVTNGTIQLSPFGDIVEAYWKDLPSRYSNVELDAFVVMPNHIHGIVVISVGAIHELPLYQQTDRRRMLLTKAIGYIKMNTAKRINRLQNTTGISVWQRNYYEHVIRNEESLNNIREYIAENPLRWALDKENPVNISVR